MKFQRVGMLLLFVLYSVGMVGVAKANAQVTVCVNDIVGLRQALLNWIDAVKTPDGTDTTIKLVRGSYVIDNAKTTHKLGVFHRSALTGGLQILGGYGVGCDEAGRVVDPTNTVIDGNSQMNSELTVLGILGDALIEGIRFTRMDTGVRIVQLYSPGGVAYEYVMRRIRVDHNLFANTIGVRIHATGGPSTVVLDSSVIVNNSGSGTYFIDVTTGTGGTTNVIGNTVANNKVDLNYSSSPAVMLVQDYSTAVTENIENNILWANKGLSGSTAIGDVDVSIADSPNTGSTVNVANNVYSLLLGAVVTSQNNLNVDPRFVFPGGGDFHLLSGSPAIDAGLDMLPGGLPATDVEGNPRLNGTHVDIGAYEYGPLTDRIFGDDLGG